MIPYQFHFEAEEELAETAMFYESRVNGLGASFTSAVQQTVNLIREHPDSDDEPREEYDLKRLKVRKLGPGRNNFGDVVRLEPDVAEAFPNADSINEALRSLIRVSKNKAPNIRRTI